MGQTAKTPRGNRTITVDFQDESTYFRLINDGKAFVECVLAFILSLGFQRFCRKFLCVDASR